jgi:hypothetical protein
MYRKPGGQITVYDFVLPFGGKLREDNRWVKKATLIPWDEIEEKYACLFPSLVGNVAKPARMALGALIIQATHNYSDRETVEQIRENPYLQFFLGFKEFNTDIPFNASLMVFFRKRFDAEKMSEINEMITLVEQKKKEKEDTGGDDGGNLPSGGGKPPKNKGKLILDATCAPADIRYPTDLSLLNEAREKLEEMIDTLHEPLRDSEKKPRTYRKKARRLYLKAAKNRKPKKQQIRKAVKQQLGFVARDLRSIDGLLSLTGDCVLSRRQQDELEVIRELCRQQQYMYEQNTHSVEDRIVSISQPHVRPIVRGKAGSGVEFGAKVAISLANGYAFLEQLNWNNFNESTTLQASVESYKERFGYYPEAVITDQIYRSRDNIRYCKDRGVRLSGPRLGRLPETELQKEKHLQRQDSKNRNAVEGKFGEGKRRYGLARIMARLRETGETAITLQLLVMNLEHRLRILFYLFYRLCLRGKQWLNWAAA